MTEKQQIRALAADNLWWSSLKIIFFCAVLGLIVAWIITH